MILRSPEDEEFILPEVGDFNRDRVDTSEPGAHEVSRFSCAANRDGFLGRGAEPPGLGWAKRPAGTPAARLTRRLPAMAKGELRLSAKSLSI